MLIKLALKVSILNHAFRVKGNSPLSLTFLDNSFTLIPLVSYARVLSSLCPTFGHAEKYDHRYCEVSDGLLVFICLFFWLLHKNNVVSVIPEKKMNCTPLGPITITNCSSFRTITYLFYV